VGKRKPDRGALRTRLWFEDEKGSSQEKKIEPAVLDRGSPLFMLLTNRNGTTLEGG